MSRPGRPKGEQALSQRASAKERPASVLAAGVLALFAATCAVEAVAQAGDDKAYATGLAEAVNAYRKAKGLPNLEADASLATIAAAHSAAMAKAGKLGHDGFPDRVRQSGLAMCVENVGWNYPSAQAQFDAWRQSPGHDGNMRRAGLEKAGVGTARGYVTWIACGP